jgi:outer membrane protein TolC
MMLKVVDAHHAAGLLPAADLARAQTEASLREREYLESQGKVRVVSAQLAELLNLPPETYLAPLEPALAPVRLVPEDAPLEALVAQGLASRPELAETSAYSRAAFERWRAAKWAPLLPGMQLNVAAGGFGGGPNDFFGNFDGRLDVAAGAVWRFESLGLGDLARMRERRSQYAQTTLYQQAVAAEIGRQIVAAATVAQVRRQELTAAQRAVQAARESYRLNLDRARTAPEKTRPIELLQAVQALARSRLDYLQVVADYDRAQFRLYAALGNPSHAALDHAECVPVAEPVTPRR